MPQGGGHERSDCGGERSTVRSRLRSEGERDIPTVRTTPWWAEEELTMCREDVTGRVPPWWLWEEALDESEGNRLSEETTARGRLSSQLGDDDPTPAPRRSPRRRGPAAQSRGFDPHEDWWVKNADSLVGPVTTKLLLAGILAGRVPLSCEVLSVKERIWRPVISTAPFDEAFARLVGPHGRRPR
jgi:hypothetical protein